MQIYSGFIYKGPALIRESVRQAWINGWREGRGDNWDGMTGTAGIHRLNEINAVG